MSIADNSYFAYNQNDYIDLETALAEEEAASVSYSLHSNEHDRTFRLSFKNYDDNAVQSLRRSLVTPLSATSREDPMYKAMEQNTWKQHSNYSPRVDNEPLLRTRVSLSPSPSVADSLAHYNKLIDDSSEVDLVKSDLRDFMGPYGVNEVMLRPDYLTPSPQSNHRYKKDALVTRLSPLLSVNNTRSSPEYIAPSPVDELKEACPPYRGSLLLELASKPAKSDKKDNISTNEMQRHIDVPSARRSVQISSLPETITAQKRSSEAKTIVSRYSQRLPSTLRRASVEESSSVTPPLDSLLSRYSTKNQDFAAETHHIQRKDVTASSRYSQRRLSAENTSKNQIQNTVAESSTAASRYTQRRSSNEDNSKTITSRYSQRRLSTDHTDTKPKVETKRYESRQSTTTATHPKPRDLSTVTSRYSQRRLSTEKAIDIKPKLEQKRPDLRYPTTTETRKPKLPTRDISTISSRYCQRRLSTENTDTKNAENTRSRATSIRLEPARTNTYQSQSNRNSFVPNEATKDAEPIETRRYSARGRLTTTATSTNTRDAEKYVPNDTKHHQAGITITRKASLRDRTLTSNRMNDLTKHPSEATPRDTGQNQAGSSRTRRVSFNLDEPSHENPSDKHPTLNINKRDSYHGGYDEQVNVKVTPPRRPRSFSVPNNEERHSLLPVLSTRVRKYSNPKPETVREEEIMSSRSKEKRPFVNTQQLMSPSHSIVSSISTDSTQSGDFDAGPATPPRYSYMEHQQVRPASKPISQSVSAVLLQVKQSRARTAAIINGMYK